MEVGLKSDTPCRICVQVKVWGLCLLVWTEILPSMNVENLSTGLISAHVFHPIGSTLVTMLVCQWMKACSSLSMYLSTMPLLNRMLLIVKVFQGGRTCVCCWMHGILLLEDCELLCQDLWYYLECSCKCCFSQHKTHHLHGLVDGRITPASSIFRSSCCTAPAASRGLCRPFV